MRLLGFIISIFLLTGCIFRSSRAYDYKVSLKKPVNSDSLLFEDSVLLVRFQVERKQLGIDLLNKGEDSLIIDWDKATINLNGETESLIHRGFGISSEGVVQPPTTLEPGGHFVDGLVPVSSIFHQGDFRATTKNIFPEYDFGSRVARRHIKGMEGSQFTLNLPISIQGKSVPYQFEFRIDDVIRKW